MIVKAELVKYEGPLWQIVRMPEWQLEAASVDWLNDAVRTGRATILSEPVKGWDEYNKLVRISYSDCWDGRKYTALVDYYLAQVEDANE